MTGRATRVLVVEDDRVLRRACEAMLAGAGFEVTTAEDGEIGLRLAREGRPDIVLLDLLMPKLDGAEVLRALKADAATAQIPVMILSNSSREDYRETCLALGAAEYHLKSNLPLRELVVRVGELTRGKTASTTAGTAPGESDRAVDLDELARRVEYDRAIVADIVDGYRQDMPGRMARLGAAVAAGSAVEVERAAHRVHGALLLVGAARAARVAMRIETSGLAAPPGELERLFAALVREVEAVGASLDEHAREEGR